jgi:hypothetical protein
MVVWVMSFLEPLNREQAKQTSWQSSVGQPRTRYLHSERAKTYVDTILVG